MKKWVWILMIGLLLTGCGNATIQQDVTADKQKMEATEEISEENPTSVVQEEKLTDIEETSQEEEVGTTYTYEDMTITIPASWENKYIIRDGQDGFALIQKASDEKEEGWGYLFGFYKSNEMIDESTGATQLAYTDECMYYMQEPTDVAFWYEDEMIAAEYGEMMLQKETIVNSLVVDADGVRYDAHEYVLPMSDVKEIPEFYLENMSSDQFWIARNEIFARHGREFDNAYLSNYFDSCSWYDGKIAAQDFNENVLSQTEKRNLEVIKSYEDRKASEKPYPQSCQFGKEYSYDLDGDGREEKLCITYNEREESGLYDVQLMLDGDLVIDGTVYDLSRDDVVYFCLNTDEFFITDISPYYEGVEIAVMDYGMSDDLVTHFYVYDGELKYIGTVGGFPFKKYMNLDGFAWEGCVKGTLRTDLIHTCFSYANWFYDHKEKKLKLPESMMYQMVPTGGYELTENIEVFTAQDIAAPKTVLKSQMVFFLQTDGAEWIKIKGKDGKEGYLHITEGKIDGVEGNPQEIISGLFFAG